MSASAQIERFLRANPYGHLYVTVGYASTAGLAWLNTRTQGRPVTLVIGNAKNTYFAEATRLWTEMHDLISEAWDCKGRIVRYLENSDSLTQQRRQPIEPARALTAPVHQPDALTQQSRQFNEIREPLATPDYRARRRRHRKRHASRRNRPGCTRSVALICMGLLLIAGLMIALSVLLGSLSN